MTSSVECAISFEINVHIATIIENEINAVRLTKFENIVTESPGNPFDFSSKRNRFGFATKIYQNAMTMSFEYFAHVGLRVLYRTIAHGSTT